ncbi:hypothetical protein [Ileibacterium valens]|uniref:hypothetical protein n=1 Tax=Ileibacterium valens TaxID=1862668 RepID=UPI002731CA74|nr:hypothetical protein [Ileibacterium valens]
MKRLNTAELHDATYGFYSLIESDSYSYSEWCIDAYHFVKSPTLKREDAEEIVEMIEAVYFQTIDNSYRDYEEAFEECLGAKLMNINQEIKRQEIKLYKNDKLDIKE